MTPMRRLLLLSLCFSSTPLFTSIAHAHAAAIPALPQTDRIRMAEAFRLADWIGERLWPGWSTTRFAVLLITKDHEFLVRHPSPEGEWRAIGHDALLGSEVFTRPRVFPPNLQAAFPFGGVPTVIAGQAEHTGSGHSTAWVSMLLHEHFHQWQHGAPGYFDALEALGLAGDDKTGMWMLNYPFPYGAAKTADAYAALSRAVARALAGERSALSAVAATQRQLVRTVGPKDFSYLDFQLWQEGVARYTELRVAELASSHYQPGAGFAALPDFQPYASVAAALRRRIVGELEKPDLARQKRVAVYALGAGLALLLDQCDPTWRDRYLSQRFTMSKPVGEAAVVRAP